METSWWLALAGGALIGLSAGAMMFFTGRVTGISGMLGGLLQPAIGEIGWRAAFIAGLVVGGVALTALEPSVFEDTTHRSLATVAAAGLLVGFGTRMGNGCTSGHGVCGISRMSPRSLIATVAFIASGAVAVAIFGGAS